MLALHSAPDEVNYQMQRLREQLRSNDADVAQECSVPLSIVLINIHTSKAMRHLAPVVVRYYFQIVALIACFHHFKQRLWIVEGVSDLGHQLLLVVLAEIDELGSVQFQRLQQQFHIFVLGFLLFSLSAVNLSLRGNCPVGLLCLRLLGFTC